MRKKIFSIALAVILALQMTFPSYAGAAAGVTSAGLNSAGEYVLTTGTYTSDQIKAKVGTDYSTMPRIFIDGDVTINLNTTGENALNLYEGIHVTEGNTLTITGNGELVLQVDAFKHDDSAIIGGNGTENVGTINIDSGNIKATLNERNDVFLGTSSNFDGGAGAGIININGGTITANFPKVHAASSIFAGGYKNTTSGTINIKGGTINTNASIGTFDKGTLDAINISNGIINFADSDSYYAAANIGGNEYGLVKKINITGGKINLDNKGRSCNIGYAEELNISNGILNLKSFRNDATCIRGVNNINISGGDITAENVTSLIPVIEPKTNINVQDKKTVFNMTGGTVKAIKKSDGEAVIGNTNATHLSSEINISDGHFISENRDGSRSTIGKTGDVFSTGTDGHAVIEVSDIYNKSNKDSWTGIIILDEKEVFVNGTTLNINHDFTVPAGKTMYIPEGTAITNSGTITNNGNIIAAGTLNGNVTGSGVIGTVPGGNLSGGAAANKNIIVVDKGTNTDKYEIDAVSGGCVARGTAYAFGGDTFKFKVNPLGGYAVKEIKASADGSPESVLTSDAEGNYSVSANSSLTINMVYADKQTVSVTDKVWTPGTWDVTSDITLTDRVDVKGKVILNLGTGTTLNAPGGIHVGPGNTLIIQGEGKLIANYPESKSGEYAYFNNSAAIGGNCLYKNGGGVGEACGTIIIKSGTVEATGKSGAAIGASNHAEKGTSNIEIQGGKVTAVSEKSAIGGGLGTADIKISGGNVTATGGYMNAGIGAYFDNGKSTGGNANIEITGGTIVANGEGAGIGGGANNTITITGDTTHVTANGKWGYGIGGAKTKDNITISGGTINVSESQFGIGSKNHGVFEISGGIVNLKDTNSKQENGITSGNKLDLSITGGEVNIDLTYNSGNFNNSVGIGNAPQSIINIGGNAKVNSKAKNIAIGGGENTTVNISGGEVTAYGEVFAGIGGNSNTNNCNINITGGIVTAKQDMTFDDRVAIGGGKTAKVNISGGDVTADSKGAGIGAGTNGTASEVVISGGNVNITAKSSYGISNNFSTGTNGNAVIKSNAKITDKSKEAEWSGVITTNNKDYTVHGNPVLNKNLEVAAGETLNVPANASLSMKNNATLTNNGTITVEKDGKLDIRTEGGKFTGNEPQVNTGGEYVAEHPDVCTIKFNNQGHGTAPIEQQINYQGKINDPGNLTADGYTFGGWYREAACTNKWDFANNTALDHMTLYAKWTPVEYTITFNSNGGSAVTAIAAGYDTAVTAPADPTKTGYTFGGWYTDSKLHNQFTFNKMPLNGAALYAKWTANKYSVKFNANSGTGRMTDQEFTYDTEAALNANAFTKAGYTFSGWNTKAGGDGTAYVDKEAVKNLTADNNGIINLYAKWTADTDTKYVVNHMQQNISDDNYTLKESVEMTGTTDTDTAAAAKTYEGFTAGSVTQAKIKGDGTTVIEIKYDRNLYNLSWDLQGGIAQNVYTTGKVRYGAPVIAPQPLKGGHTLSWNSTPVTTMPAGDLSYTANWTLNKPETPVIKATPDNGEAIYPENVTLEAQFTEIPGLTYTYTWYKDDAEAGKGKTITIDAINKSGNYTVEVKVNNGTISQTSDRSTTQRVLLNEAAIGGAINQTGTLTYNEKPQRATVTNSFYANGNEMTVKYGSVQGEYNLDQVPEFTDAGTHKVYYMVTADNHIALKGNFDVVIKKAVVDVSSWAWNEGNSFNYDGTSKSVTLKDINEGLNLVNVSYTDNTKTNADTYTAKAAVTPKDAANYEVQGTVKDFTWNINKGNLTVTAEDKTVKYGTDAPSYTVKYDGFVNKEDQNVLKGTLKLDCDYTSASEAGTTHEIIPSGLTSANYNISFVNGTLTVGKADAAVSAPAANDLTFNNTDQALVTAGTVPAGAEMQYSLEQNGTYTDAVPTGKNQGTYTVWYKVLGGKNYADQEAKSVTVTIKQKDITGATVTLGDKLTYTGSELTQNVTKVEIDGLTATVDVTDNTATDYGTYTLTVTGNGNFTGTAAKEFSVAKAESSVTEAPVAEDLTYTGVNQKLVKAGTATGGEMVYSLTERGEFTASVPEGKDVKAYTVYYKVKGDKNHNDSAAGKADVTIKQAPLKITAEDKTVKYGAEAPSYTVKYDGFVNKETKDVLGGKLAYECSYTNKSDVGTYDIKPSGLTSSNYDISFVNGKVTVNKADAAVTGPEAKDITYNGKNQILVTAGTVPAGAEMQYSLSETSGYGTAIPEAKNHGTYTVYYKVAGGKNYNDQEAKTITVTIAQAPLTITASDQNITYAEKPSIMTGVSQVTADGLAETDQLEGITLTAAADYTKVTPSAAVVKNAGTDATSNYKITYIDGNLTRVHDWNAAEYKWEKADGKWTCTATRTDKNNEAVKETDKATVTSKVVKEATTIEMGDTEYTAEFKAEWAETQKQTVTDISKLPIYIPEADKDKTVKLDIDVKTENGKVTAEITENIMNGLVEEAIEKGAKEITINAKKDKTAKSVVIKTVKESIARASEKGITIIVKTPAGEMNLTSQVLGATVKAAEAADFTIVIEKTDNKTDKRFGENAVTFELKLMSGGKEIHDFNGQSVKVQLPVPEKLEKAALAVLHIGRNGFEKMNAKAVILDGKLHVEFDTPHFSEFVITDEATADKLMAEQNTDNNDRIREGVKNTKIKLTSKSTKGGIRLTWKKTPGYRMDGYEVHRSVKKYSGFGKEPYFRAKGTTYKNTKELKKGTRYYYKVRGYRYIDGEKVYTDWSTKAYRIYK